MSKKAINVIVAIVMFVSSFSTLYVCVNITSLDKELSTYVQGTPYAPVIKVGEMGYYSKLIMGQYKWMNQVNSLVYFLSGEANTFSSTTPEIEIPVLTDVEIVHISKLRGIKSAFSFDNTDLIRRWTVRAPFGKGEFVYPVTSQYLKALHPPLKEGRYFEEGDPPNVLLVQEDYVKNLVQGSDVLGKSVTVHTRSGTEQFTIIGVLANIPPSYRDSSTSLPASVVVPYRPGRESSYVRGDGKIIPLPSKPQLWIVPQEGHEQRLLAEIRKILGNEKYKAVVSSSTWEFENSFGIQVRRERITTLAASSALTVLIGILTISSLIYVDIAAKRRELGIKRSVGATTVQIAREYTSSLLRLLCLSFLMASLVLVLLLPVLTRFNMLGEYLTAYRSPAEVLPLHLSVPAVLSAFGLLAILVAGVTAALVHRSLKGTPAGLLIAFGVERENRTRLVVLAIVTTVSVMAAFTSLSLMTTIRRTTQDLVRDVPQQTTIIGPSDSTVIYTVDDYDAVRQVLRGKALVGCRKTTPAYSTAIWWHHGSARCRSNRGLPGHL
jgi:predicted transcriptional regulator